MLEYAYNTLLRLELLEYYKNLKISENDSIIFSNILIIKYIKYEIVIDYPSYSGASLAIILRKLKYYIEKINI